jgi:hypothetical protein
MEPIKEDITNKLFIKLRPVSKNFHQFTHKKLHFKLYNPLYRQLTNNLVFNLTLNLQKQ